MPDEEAGEPTPSRPEATKSEAAWSRPERVPAIGVIAHRASTRALERRSLRDCRGYSLPSIASEMIRIWISDVPSKIFVSLASRQ